MRPGKLFATIILCCCYINGYSQSTQVSKYITEITNIIKQNSIVARQIDWNKYDKDISVLSGGINEVDSCRPVLNYIINTLRSAGDKHSFFINKSGVAQLKSGPSKPKQAEARLLDSHTGYIKVPGILSFNTQANNAFRDTIQQFIKKLDTENDITAWVVDLRNPTHRPGILIQVRK